MELGGPKFITTNSTQQARCEISASETLTTRWDLGLIRNLKKHHNNIEIKTK